MPGANVQIKQDIKKHVRKFITQRGDVLEGGPEVHLGHNMGGLGRPNRFPDKSK